MKNSNANEWEKIASWADVAAAVKRRREAEGIKQLTLAQLAGVTERTIQRLERGQKMGDQTVRRVAAALGLTEETLSMIPVPAVGRVEVVPPSAGRPVQTVKEYFVEMIAFDRWANEGLLTWIESHPEIPELTKIFAHLIAENLPWLYVLRGEVVPPDVDPVPDWSLAECRARFGPTMDALSDFVAELDAEEFNHVVRSYSPAGATFEHTISQVITNLLGHAEHHRGQIVALIAQETGQYVPTAYMSYLRCRN